MMSEIHFTNTVTDQDLRNPEFMAMLKRMGFTGVMVVPDKNERRTMTKNELQKSMVVKGV